MNVNYRLYFTLVCLFFDTGLISIAQQNTRFVLLHKMHEYKEDTAGVNAMISLAAMPEYRGTDSSLVLCNEAIRISTKLNYKEGIGLARNVLAEKYYERGELTTSIGLLNDAIDLWRHLLEQHKGDTDALKRLRSYLADANASLCMNLLSSTEYFRALDLAKTNLQTCQAEGYTRGVIRFLILIGTVYEYQSDYVRSLEYFFKSQQLCSEKGMYEYEAQTLNCIGSVYAEQNQHEIALDYYKQALDIGQRLGDRYRVGIQLGQIGTAYFDMGNYQEALNYQFKALALSKELKDTEGDVTALFNIANAYFNLNQPEKVLSYYHEAERILSERRSLRELALTLFNTGIYYAVFKDYDNSEKYLNRALALSDSIGYLENSYSANVYLCDVNRARGRFEKALEYYDASVILKDSLFGIEKDKAITEKELTYEFEKKEMNAKSEQEKKDLLTNEQLHREKVARYSFMVGLVIVGIFSLALFRQKKKITIERDRSEELLLNILPSETAEELKSTGSAKTRSYGLVTVLFTDFKNFTRASELMTPEQLVEEINYCYCEFDKIITRFGIEKIKTIGDSYMCAGGLPAVNETHAYDTVMAALAIQSFMQKYKEEKEKKHIPCFELRLGIHTGPVVAGIVGIKKFAYDIWGDTVNVASRMESHGEVGKVNISEATYSIVRNKFLCVHRGMIDVKNKGMIDMYFVEQSI